MFKTSNILPALLALLSSSCYGSPLVARNSSSECRCFPGDSCWPSIMEWDAFNSTVGGKLVTTVPIAAVCHKSAYGSYDAEACEELRSNWFYPQVHLSSSSSIMAPYFTNNSCNPFMEPDAPCMIGNYVSYTVNATSSDDFIKTIAFVRQRNIRLTIRNTGHDYMGKAAGAGALSIWTHYMQDKEIVPYNSSYYTGKALKMGAGVMVQDSFNFTHAHGLVNVGGDCPTVGVAGGYTQGGGHGPLGSIFGLASDQALEWEVVTGTGELMTATPEKNQDMYWALSGGGGQTYGVVSSLTVKTYPDMMTTACNLTFSAKDTTADKFWDVASTWQASVPNFVGSGCYANWDLAAGTFVLEPATCPNKTKDEMTALLQPTLNKLKDYNISNTFYITQFPTFYESYVAYNTPWNVSENQLGGRLIPKTLIESNNSALMAIIRDGVDNQNLAASGVALNVSQAKLPPGGNSVTPVWRTAVFDFLFGSTYNYTSYLTDTMLADEMTTKYLPPVEALTPGGGSYMNEANFQQPDYQQTFYGGNWDRLLQIKDKYDPDQIFYALTGVGSDRWYEDQSQGGRLCKVPA